MDSEKPGAKFSSNILSRVFDDDHSVGSGKSDKSLLAQLFFENAVAKVAAPIGEVSLSGNYPLCDKSWSFWITDQDDNTHNLSEHEKCNIEYLNQCIRHQNTVIEKLKRPCQPFSTLGSASTLPTCLFTRGKPSSDLREFSKFRDFSENRSVLFPSALVTILVRINRD